MSHSIDGKAPSFYLLDYFGNPVGIRQVDGRQMVGVKYIDETGRLTTDLLVRDELVEIKTILKKVAYHLSLATDTDLEDHDV